VTTPDTDPVLPLGAPVEGWTPRPRPARTVLEGRYCRVEPLDAARHATDLFEANGTDRTGRMWHYLAYGPFGTLAEYHERLLGWQSSEDPLFCAIVDRGDRALGIGSYLRIDAANGVIEVGHLQYSPLLQKTRAATEAMYLMMRQVFGLGYRRYEWKCDSLNAASRRAAERLGFRFEGVFRQAMVYKGRNRDTAWYSIIDREWPAVAAGFEAWLAPSNFDASGRQHVGLVEARRRQRGAAAAC
jgi:RimJ/RimL family protein N-acetyltransferase